MDGEALPFRAALEAWGDGAEECEREECERSERQL